MADIGFELVAKYGWNMQLYANRRNLSQRVRVVIDGLVLLVAENL